MSCGSVAQAPTPEELYFRLALDTSVWSNTLGKYGLRVAAPPGGAQIPYLPIGWLAQLSRDIDGVADIPCKVISPALRGLAGLQEALDAARTLRSHGHISQGRCFAQIHIGGNISWSETLLSRLVTHVANREKALWFVGGIDAISSDVELYGCSRLRYSPHTRAEIALELARSGIFRRTVSIVSPDDKRTEAAFCSFGSTLNTLKLATWVQMCIGFVCRVVADEQQTYLGACDNLGYGEAVEELFSFLEWSPNGGKQYGWISPTIPQRRIVDLFIRSARRLDRP